MCIKSCVVQWWCPFGFWDISPIATEILPLTVRVVAAPSYGDRFEDMAPAVKAKTNRCTMIKTIGNNDYLTISFWYIYSSLSNSHWSNIIVRWLLTIIYDYLIKAMIFQWIYSWYLIFMDEHTMCVAMLWSRQLDYLSIVNMTVEY